LALKYHPDKFSGASDQERTQAESQFREVAEAYEILSNSEKRAAYDRGDDLMEQPQGFNPFQGAHFTFSQGGFQFNF